MSKHDMLEIMRVELDKGTKTIEFFKQFTPIVYCDREEGYCKIIAPKFLMKRCMDEIYYKWMESQ